MKEECEQRERMVRKEIGEEFLCYIITNFIIYNMMLHELGFSAGYR